ncbi:testis-expressed protein 47-like [Callorhinchus milii]|uniref:testis-expressed protein 47-like n=1 Tax=Callorhinchus milii TaxID=7868 RepID=UPI0004575D6A|nr:testis-expressed protein 47-like [Callorhinchus milii]|eukprot:gi/632943681/ref/XP_007887079.1/ PREDICTED: uncharacterized protein C7orf62-like [Callorhinchus milii]
MGKSGKEEAKSLLHRLYLLAKISPDLADKRHLAVYYQSLFQKLQRLNPGEGITGHLMLYSDCAVHAIESSSEVLYSVLRDAQDMKQGDRVLLLESKILVISHNIPSRLFQQWEYHQVPTITTQRLDDALQKEPTEKVISECLSLLLRLGVHMRDAHKSKEQTQTVSNHLSQCVGNVPEGLDGLLEDIPELIVPLDVIDRLLKCNELLTPAQFLEMYDSPLNIIMDSELVWPSPQHILPIIRK